VFTNPLKQQQKSGGAKAALLHCWNFTSYCTQSFSIMFTLLDKCLQSSRFGYVTALIRHLAIHNTDPK
jgi:hypothetical protein